jgi:hypothetical protein
MTDYFVFDCEIKKCIPDRNGVMDALLITAKTRIDKQNKDRSRLGISIGLCFFV